MTALVILVLNDNTGYDPAGSNKKCRDFSCRPKRKKKQKKEKKELLTLS